VYVWSYSVQYDVHNIVILFTLQINFIINAKEAIYQPASHSRQEVEPDMSERNESTSEGQGHLQQN